MPPNPMPGLFRRLAEFGLTEAHVREHGLPEWWDDEIAENPAGYAEGLVYLSRNLGLDFASLFDAEAPIRYKRTKCE